MLISNCIYQIEGIHYEDMPAEVGCLEQLGQPPFLPTSFYSEEGYLLPPKGIAAAIDTLIGSAVDFSRTYSGQPRYAKPVSYLLFELAHPDDYYEEIENLPQLLEEIRKNVLIQHGYDPEIEKAPLSGPTNVSSESHLETLNFPTPYPRVVLQKRILRTPREITNEEGEQVTLMVPRRISWYVSATQKTGNMPPHEVAASVVQNGVRLFSSLLSG